MSRVLSARVPDELAAWADAEAARRGVKRADVVIDALRRASGASVEPVARLERVAVASPKSSPEFWRSHAARVKRLEKGGGRS